MDKYWRNGMVILVYNTWESHLSSAQIVIKDQVGSVAITDVQQRVTLVQTTCGCRRGVHIRENSEKWFGTICQGFRLESCNIDKGRKVSVPIPRAFNRDTFFKYDWLFGLFKSTRSRCLFLPFLTNAWNNSLFWFSVQTSECVVKGLLPASSTWKL